MRHLTESMQVKAFMVLFTLVSLLWACSSVQTEKTAPLPGDLVANFPQMMTGDQWVTSTSHGVTSSKVIDVKADGSFTLGVQNEDGSIMFHRYYDNNYCLTKEINTATGARMKIPSPPAQNLNFPLFVGKRWADEYQGTGADNIFRTFKNKYEVEKIEMVSTQAGTFKAFKIHRAISAIGNAKSMDQYYYYSPELKIVLKLRHSPDFKTASGYPIHIELLSHKMAIHNKETLQAGAAPITPKDKDAADNFRNEKVSNIRKESPVGMAGIVGARWAVIIGVSQYKDTRISQLRYAAADASSFYDWIVSPQGGKFAPSMVKLLTDADATGVNIKKALFEWLAQAIEEDTVTIYFAGHGSPQSPDHPENLFLLPYDTQYDSVQTTGFPMWDIETALKRFIKAKKVIVITDACHAGGVGQGFDVARRAGRGVNVVPISSSLQSLSKINDGVCIISASDDNQLSQESAQWGGGHGVFTFHLVEGLKGKADYNKDGIVTLGEIIPFLSEQVRRETRNAQAPTVAGRFDPALSIGK